MFGGEPNAFTDNTHGGFPIRSEFAVDNMFLDPTCLFILMQRPSFHLVICICSRDPMASTAQDQMKAYWKKNLDLQRPNSPWMIYRYVQWRPFIARFIIANIL